MHQTLLFLHSIFRWLVLLALFSSFYMAWRGYRQRLVFGPQANRIRHLTATSAHVQLIIGITLYFQSPVVKQFLAVKSWSGRITEPLFFGCIHITMMVCAILVLSIGSAVSKRARTDQLKYKTMLIWFGIALLIILAAIPWPFSILAQRPLIRAN